MRGGRFDRILTTTAVALVLATGSLSAMAAMGDRDDISAAIPMPEAANVPPPTAADIAAPPTAPAPLSQQDIEARIPLPDAADLPPPSLADVGGPATGATPATAPREAKPDIAAQPAAARNRRPRSGSSSRASGSSRTGRQGYRGAAAGCRSGRGKPHRHGDPRARRREARPPDRPQERAFGGRGVLCQARFRAAVDRERRGVGARQGGDRLPRARVDAEGLDPADYPTPVFRSGAEPAALAEADVRMTAVAADLCAACAERPRALVAHQRRHPL